jgi:hypothetical protein
MKITLIKLIGSAPKDTKTVHIQSELSETEAKELIKNSEYSDYKVTSVETINIGKGLTTIN